MARITDIYLVETPEQQAIAITARIGVSGIPAVIEEGFLTLEKYVQGNCVIPSNTPFLRMDGCDPAALDVTVGMEVPSALRGAGQIKAAVIPAGKKIFCYWQGDNAGMAPLHEEMRSFAAGHGYKLAQGCYEYYLTGADRGIDKLLTKVVMLLE